MKLLSIAYARSRCRSGPLLLVLVIVTSLLMSAGCTGRSARRGAPPIFVQMPPLVDPQRQDFADGDERLGEGEEAGIAYEQEAYEVATSQTETTVEEYAVEAEADPFFAVATEPEPFAGLSGDDAYILRPGDVVNLQVFREPEISGSFQLSSAGVIRHPLLGVVALSGITVSAAEEHIRHRLATEYLVNPRVILKAETMPSMQVLLMGAVRRPGAVSIPYGGRITLLEAIAAAGGFTDLASPNRIRVVRTVDGKNVTLRVRAGDILSGRGKQRDIVLEPHDIVTIPEVRF